MNGEKKENVVKNILDSFKNNKSGYAARKLSAFAIMICIIYCHYKYVDAKNVIEVLIIDFSALFLLLGLVTAQNIIELKNGKQTTNANPDTQAL